VAEYCVVHEVISQLAAVTEQTGQDSQADVTREYQAYVEHALVPAVQLVTIWPCSVTYSSAHPAHGVIVARVVQGVVVMVTVTAAHVSSSSAADVMYDVAFVKEVTVVSQYVQVGLFLRNSSHPSVGSTVIVTVRWLYVIMGDAETADSVARRAMTEQRMVAVFRGTTVMQIDYERKNE
jgi:hypothetical protein